MSAETIELFNDEITRYFRKKAHLDGEILQYNLTNYPGSWQDFKEIVQDIEIYNICPDFSDKITSGGWAAAFLLQNRDVSQKDSQYYSTLTVSCVLIDLSEQKILSPFSVIAAGSSMESYEQADIKAVRNLPDQIHNRLLQNGFYPQGDFNHADTGRVWVFRNNTIKLKRGDECLVEPRGYGQVLDVSGDYYKIWVSDKPSLAQKGGTLKPYIKSGVEINAGGGMFYNIKDADFGAEAFAEVQFKRNFRYFRPMAGACYLFYDPVDNPLILYGGVAYSRLLGRLRLDVCWAVCFGQRFSPKYGVSHLGSKLAVHAAIPLFRFMQLRLEGGLLNLEGVDSPTVNGVVAGAALVIQ